MNLCIYSYTVTSLPASDGLILISDCDAVMTENSSGLYSNLYSAK